MIENKYILSIIDNEIELFNIIPDKPEISIYYCIKSDKLFIYNSQSNQWLPLITSEDTFADSYRLKYNIGSEKDFIEFKEMEEELNKNYFDQLYPKYKIIFLDIDGVLNGYNFFDLIIWKISSLLHIQKYYKSHRKDPFGIHIEKLKRLAKIIEHTNAKVVLSSSWRRQYFKPYSEKDEKQKLLYDLFTEYNIDVIDKTPELNQYYSRCDEILLWLRDHLNYVDRYIILDDENFDLDYFGENFIQTSSIKEDEIIKGYWRENTGLKRKHVKKAIKLLNQ
jgi:hypothetical protein